MNRSASKRPRQVPLVMWRFFCTIFSTFLLISVTGAGAMNQGKAVNLPFQDINIVVLTDSHSWVAGRGRHEEHTYNADYGHVLSFVERLKDQHPSETILFVMNGDFMDGTGLSTYPPLHLVPLLEHMPYDGVNIGNHELYQNSTVEYILESGFRDFWEGRYLTSNVLLRSSFEPIGSRYAVVQDDRRIAGVDNSTNGVLMFGFLYNMQNNCEITVVEQVEDAVSSEWFRNALLNEAYDAIVVLAHMDVQDHLVSVILRAIRKIIGSDTAVQFITGHTHYRGYSAQWEDEDLADETMAASFEAGHYMDTIGFASFSIANGTFEHVFLDANVKTLQQTLGLDPDLWMTTNGIRLSNQIRTTQEKLGLLKTVACSPRHYRLEDGLDKTSSLWRLFLEKVINEFYFEGDKTKVFVGGPGAFRSDLWDGDVLVDDIIAVSPFNDTVYKVDQELSGEILLDLLGGQPNQVGLDPTLPFMAELPHPYVCSILNSKVDVTANYEMYSVSYDARGIIEKLQRDHPRNDNSEWSASIQTVPGEEGIVTNLGLWSDFLTAEWPDCSSSSNDETGQGVSAALPILEFVALVVAVVVAFCVGRVCYYKCRRRGFSNVESNTQEFSGKNIGDLMQDDDDELL